MPWESVLYVGVLIVVMALVFVDRPGQSREDRRVSRLMRGKR